MSKIRDEWIASIGYYDETEKQKVRALLYGPMGVGKTTFAATFPNPLFIDSDKGGLTLRKLNIPYISIEHGEKAYEKVSDILDALRNREAPFDEIQVDTIVFDSLTSLMDIFMYETVKFPSGPGKPGRDPVNTKPEYDDYMKVGNRMKTTMLRCKDLKVNVVATCGERLDKDEVLGTFVGRPNLVGSYRETIGHDFDEVYYMTTEGGLNKQSHVIYTTKYKYYDAKSRISLQSKYESPTYEKLYKGEG